MSKEEQDAQKTPPEIVKSHVISNDVKEARNEADKLYSIVPLPSKGYLYPKVGGQLLDQIRIRPMTTQEEAVLFSQAGDMGAKIGNIIEACIHDADKKHVQPNDLTLVDRFTLLLTLRTISFGSKYRVPMRCSQCRTQFKHDIDIVEDFEMKFLDDHFKENTTYDVDLPVKKEILTLRFLQGKDEKRVLKHTQRIRMTTATTPEDKSYTYRIALQIVAINGNPCDVLKAEDYVKKLSSRDATAIRLKTEELEGGIDTRMFVDCSACGYIIETSMPVEMEFFRPSTQ